MKTEFVGGTDVQRSLNHSDSRCINLVPTLNDKGDIAAFYGAAGLSLEATNPSGAVGSGIYTASNGRCFEVAGTTLYEITSVAGVITTTSRGTVTSASISRMFDNGIDLMIVNGIDGWLFTFSTNVLKKIKVAQEDFTVTIAAPAVFTKTAHGLVLGDAIRLSSTTGSILSDSLLEAIVPSTVSAQQPVAVAVAPINDFVYTVGPGVSGLTAKLLMYSRDTASGKLSPLSPPSIDVLYYGLNDLKITSDGISGYSTIDGLFGSSFVATFAINTTTGQATWGGAGTLLTQGTSSVGVTISPNDDFVYSAEFGNNVIYQYSRNLGTGELTARTPATFACAGGPQEIVISTDGLFAYVSCKTDNTIKVFSRTIATGLITETPIQTISCGGISPIGIALSPSTNNPYLYVVNNGSANVAMFSRNSTTGALTALSTATIATESSPQKISCTAESVYVTNSASNSVSQFSINSADGMLTALSSPTIATGNTPIGIVTAPDGNSVYVCNSGSSTISQFKRNGTTDTVGLPTGLDELTTYYVVTEGLTADAFEVSETLGDDNHFVNPNSPATQTSPSLPTGKYTLSITGTGSIAVAATTATITGAGSAVAGTAVNFEVTKEGTVTYTVTGTPTTARAGVTYVSTSGKQSGIHTYTTLGYGFPAGCKTIHYMNGRFAALEPSTQNFYVSEVLNGLWWDALNVQTVDANPDYAIGAAVAHQEFIVFCQNSGQVYNDSGAYPTPWAPNASGVFEVGCSAPYSIASIDNTVFWLGGNQTGDGMIWKMQGFTPVRVSTHSIEFAIQAMSDISDARAFTYQQDGHNFYVLTFPTGDRTFVYDINTGLWHERANFADGEFTRWEAQEHAYFAGKHLVLDHAEGKIYSIDNSVYTYGTEVRKWLRSFRVPTNSMLRVPHCKLQLDCEVGVGLVGESDPEVMMRFSDDGGHTWSKEYWRSMGAIGEYAKRVIWHQLGITKGQPRIYEISGTDPVKVALLNVHID
jgi:6-phosphogluconolactonase (cycloisomerase 2 family)